MKPPESPIQEAADSIANPKLRAVMVKALEHFAQMFAEAESDIESAMVAAAEASQLTDDGKEPPISIGFTVKLDMGRNKQSGKIRVAITKCHETESPLPDPNQPEFPL